MDLGGYLQGIPLVGDLYKSLYADPANRQKAEIDRQRQYMEQMANYNRQFQLQGANRALSFYGPARDVLSQMMGGAPPSGFGMTQQGPTDIPKPPQAPLPPGQKASGWYGPGGEAIPKPPAGKPPGGGSGWKG